MEIYECLVDVNVLQRKVIDFSRYLKKKLGE
jgi:hypothetical protein